MLVGKGPYQEYPFATCSKLIKTYFDEMSGDEAHHLLMTQNAEAMGASLAAWDNHSIPKPVDPTKRSYYEALAWSGAMLNTSEFNDLDEDFQNQIEDANENEGNALMFSISDQHIMRTQKVTFYRLHNMRLWQNYRWMKWLGS